MFLCIKIIKTEKLFHLNVLCTQLLMPSEMPGSVQRAECFRAALLSSTFLQPQAGESQNH